jgi:hypothetical protein
MSAVSLTGGNVKYPDIFIFMCGDKEGHGGMGCYPIDLRVLGAILIDESSTIGSGKRIGTCTIGVISR